MVLKRKKSNDPDRSILRLDICSAIPNDRYRSINDLTSLVNAAEQLVKDGYSIELAVQEVMKKKPKKKRQQYGRAEGYC